MALNTHYSQSSMITDVDLTCTKTKTKRTVGSNRNATYCLGRTLKYINPKFEEQNKENLSIENNGEKDNLKKINKKTKAIVERFKIREMLLVKENKRLNEKIDDLITALNRYETIV